MSTLPTSSRRNLHTVLGSTGGVGNALVRELVQRGYRVRAVSRSGVSNDVSAPVEVVAADLTTPTAVRAATAGSTSSTTLFNQTILAGPKSFRA